MICPYCKHDNPNEVVICEKCHKQMLPPKPNFDNIPDDDLDDDLSITSTKYQDQNDAGNNQNRSFDVSNKGKNNNNKNKNNKNKNAQKQNNKQNNYSNQPKQDNNVALFTMDDEFGESPTINPDIEKSINNTNNTNKKENDTKVDKPNIEQVKNTPPTNKVEDNQPQNVENNIENNQQNNVENINIPENVNKEQNSGYNNYGNMNMPNMNMPNRNENPNMNPQNNNQMQNNYPNMPNNMPNGYYNANQNNNPNNGYNNGYNNYGNMNMQNRNENPNMNPQNNNQMQNNYPNMQNNMPNGYYNANQNNNPNNGYNNGYNNYGNMNMQNRNENPNMNPQNNNQMQNNYPNMQNNMPNGYYNANQNNNPNNANNDNNGNRNGYLNSRISQYRDFNNQNNSNETQQRINQMKSFVNQPNANDNQGHQLNFGYTDPTHQPKENDESDLFALNLGNKNSKGKNNKSKNKTKEKPQKNKKSISKPKKEEKDLSSTNGIDYNELDKYREKPPIMKYVVIVLVITGMFAILGGLIYTYLKQQGFFRGSGPDTPQTPTTEVKTVDAPTYGTPTDANTTEESTETNTEENTEVTTEEVPTGTETNANAEYDPFFSNIDSYDKYKLVGIKGIGYILVPQEMAMTANNETSYRYNSPDGVTSVTIKKLDLEGDINSVTESLIGSLGDSVSDIQQTISASNNMDYAKITGNRTDRETHLSAAIVRYPSVSESYFWVAVEYTDLNAAQYEPITKYYTPTLTGVVPESLKNESDYN